MTGSTMAKNTQTLLSTSDRDQKVFGEFLSAIAAMGLSIFFLLVISDVPIRIAGVSVLILLLQLIAGGSCFTLFFRNIKITWQEFCGIGLAIGSLLTIGLDQIFRNTAISSFAWATPILFLPFLIRQRKFNFESFVSQNVGITLDLLPILATILLLLSAEWFWPLPVAMLLITIVIWRGYPGHRRLSGFFVIFLLPLSVFSVLSRPTGWWIEDTDVGLYEAISRTLGTWGFRDNINAAGTSTNYHWFAYAWSGLIDRISGAPSWVSNTRVLPIIIATGTILVIWSILQRLSHVRSIIIFSLFAIAGFDTVQTWGRGFKLGLIASPSQMYGLFLLLTFVYLLILDQKHLLNKAVPLFFFLGLGVVGAKVAHGVVLAGGIGISWFATCVKSYIWISHNT